MNQEELLQIIEQAAKDGVTSLDLSGKGLTILPPQIGQLNHLTQLDLSNNQLKKLPPQIGQLTHLTRLYLSYNQLQELPPQIGQLTHLTRLDLYNNQLQQLPPEIGQLTNLTRLYLSDNQIQQLPPEIGQLTNLTRLDLHNNQLSALPPEIAQLTNLTELSLDNNQLSALPPEIAQLTNLTELSLGNNQLSALPPEIAQLTNLNRLYLHNNPLTSPPPEIVQQGRQAILTYLRGRLQNSQQQWVSKLLVIGEGGVGKTSLLGVLRGEAFNTQESTTHGIEIKSLDLPHPSKTDVTMQLNTWDFAGQEINHATHQFFLTNRSLFLLTWNARHGFEQGKLYYWLDTIQALAPNSPVLLVATHIDQRDADLPLSELGRKYPQIIGQCEISSKTGNGIDALRIAIAEAAAKLPLMGEDWPSTWLKTANRLRSAPEKYKYITPKQLWDFMTQHGVTDTTSQLVLAQWLHELGDILYFRDNEELNQIVILKPQWVTQYISKVLESEDVINSAGIFTRACMEQLWHNLQPSMHDHFLRLMERFDLSYRTLENKDISLVVERLPLDPPNYQHKWDNIVERDGCREISMKFQLNTIPAGIPTWFIARQHRFTTRTHWRNGALFADEPNPKHLALMQAFPHERYLQLTVRGVNPQNFFALLKDGIEVTLKRFPGLKINRLIPCPGHNGEPCSHLFNYASLENAIQRNPPIIEIQCQESFESVSVPGLLFGLHWRTQDDVLSRIDELETTIVERQDTILDELKNLRELTQREFTNTFRREQAKIDSHCPNIFVLRPRDSKGWKKAIAGQKLDLQLYCQAPGCWHPTQGGLYQIDEPAKWLQVTAPYIRRLVGVLKYAAPLIGPWVGFLNEQDYEKLFKNDIELMKEMAAKLPETQDAGDLKLAETFDIGDVDHPERAEGAALRTLRQLLEEKDPQQHWGGLKKVLTPEGHYLWLCEHHEAQYKPVN